jgi:hypothetical protein
MSENTINKALRTLGYAGDVMTGHGFSSMASTLSTSSSVGIQTQSSANLPTLLATTFAPPTITLNICLSAGE